MSWHPKCSDRTCKHDSPCWYCSGLNIMFPIFIVLVCAVVLVTHILNY